MKKTYITPEALVVSLFANAPVLQDMTLNNVEGSGQYTKENVDDLGSTGGKSIWDEEW